MVIARCVMMKVAFQEKSRFVSLSIRIFTFILYFYTQTRKRNVKNNFEHGINLVFASKDADPFTSFLRCNLVLQALIERKTSKKHVPTPLTLLDRYFYI